MEFSSEPIRVQTLTQSGISHVPSQYIQPPENRPNHIQTHVVDDDDDDDDHNNNHVPVIDLLDFDPNRLSQVRDHIGRAFKEWGAFQVINHGVPIALLADTKNAGLTFFNDSTMNDKLTYSCNPDSPASEGYGSRMLVNSSDNAVLDWRDYFDHHTFPLSRRNPLNWPHFPPNYRHVVESYSDHMKMLAQKLLGLISDNLGLHSSCIEDAVGELYQNVTISYYPPCPQPELTLGLQAHSDFGAVTLLIQDDVGGLQVLKEDKWVNVQPLSDAIVVILADQAEILTNGAYKSAQHRAVTNANEARLSVATFHDPAKTRKICPVPELINENSPLLYKEVTYGDYVSSWYTKGPEGKRNIDALLL